MITKMLKLLLLQTTTTLRRGLHTHDDDDDDDDGHNDESNNENLGILYLLNCHDHRSAFSDRCSKDGCLGLRQQQQQQQQQRRRSSRSSCKPTSNDLSTTSFEDRRRQRRRRRKLSNRLSSVVASIVLLLILSLTSPSSLPTGVDALMIPTTSLDQHRSTETRDASALKSTRHGSLSSCNWRDKYNNEVERTFRTSFSSVCMVRGRNTNAISNPTMMVATRTTTVLRTTNGPEETSMGRQPRRPLTEKQKQAWQQKFDEMKEYQDENNGSSYPPLGDPLRAWADFQRWNFNNCQMYPYRIELLNSIDFQWCKARGEKPKLDWDMMFDRLVEYKERCGDTKIPPLQYAEEPQLGRWCYTQKYSKDKLDSDRKARLDAIGFVFDEAVPPDDRWNEKYGRLVEYWKKDNSTIVPQHYEEDPELGGWVSKQRTLYNRNDSRMTPERIERLEGIGFVWDARKALWLEMYNRLIEYRQEEGNADVPYIHKKDPKLGYWVGTQRQHYRKAKLSPDRIEKLEAIGFKWSMIQSQAEKCKLQDKLW